MKNESDKKDRKDRPHAVILAKEPEHTYVEKIHTPLRHSTDCSTEDEWLADKHAHIDFDVMSPHGFVERKQTPISHDVEDFPSQNRRSRTVYVYCAVAIAAFSIAILVLHKRRRRL